MHPFVPEAGFRQMPTVSWWLKEPCFMARLLSISHSAQVLLGSVHSCMAELKMLYVALLSWTTVPGHSAGRSKNKCLEGGILGILLLGSILCPPGCPSYACPTYGILGILQLGSLLCTPGCPSYACPPYSHSIFLISGFSCPPFLSCSLLSSALFVLSPAYEAFVREQITV